MRFSSRSVSTSRYFVDRWSRHWFVVLVLFGAGSQYATADPTMYWSDRGLNSVRRGTLNATNIEVLSEAAPGVGSQYRGVDVDLEHGYLYWADNAADAIRRSRLDGSQVEDLVTTGLNFPAGVAVDPYNEKLYWADAFDGVIQRSNLDGSAIEDVITDVTGPYFITLDFIHEQIYWTDQSSRKVQRANFDGTGIEDLVTTVSLPRGVALDLVNNKMYFADRTNDVVQRSNLDGSDVETLVTIDSPGRVSAPHGVAVDVANNHLYWVDNGTVKIQRSNLDGSNVVDLLGASPNLERPWQIVLDLEIERCDFNRSGACDGTDIDLLSHEMRSATNKALFNLDAADDEITPSDHSVWLELAQVKPGDANLDGAVDGLDLDVWTASRFSSSAGWGDADFNGDGFVDGVDFNIWNVHNDLAASDAAVVPEPGCFVSLLFGLVGLRGVVGSLRKS